MKKPSLNKQILTGLAGEIATEFQGVRHQVFTGVRRSGDLGIWFPCNDHDSLRVIPMVDTFWVLHYLSREYYYEIADPASVDRLMKLIDCGTLDRDCQSVFTKEPCEYRLTMQFSPPGKLGAWCHVRPVHVRSGQHLSQMAATEA